MLKLLGFGFLLAACSSSSSSSIDGTIRGVEFASTDAIVLGSGAQVEIVLAGGNSCVPPAQQVQHPGETALLLILQDPARVTPGSYPVVTSSSDRAAEVEGNILDAMCINNADNDAVASLGTVTLTNVDGSEYDGSFDVTFDSGDHVTGSFSATQCDQPKNPEPSCQP
jgi:hypothetical protein